MVQSHLDEFQFSMSSDSACMNGIHPTYFPDSDTYGLFGKPRKESTVFLAEKIAMVFLVVDLSRILGTESCRRLARLKMRSRSIITVASAVLLGMGVLSFVAWRSDSQGRGRINICEKI